jgi:SAM-dependent methyltransferase
VFRSPVLLRGRPSRPVVSSVRFVRVNVACRCRTPRARTLTENDVTLAMFTEQSLGIRPAADVHADCQRLLRRGVTAGMRVLDVGCGDGTLLRELCRDPGVEAVGIEIDPGLVAAACAAGLDVRLGRAEAVPIPDASVDVVLCSVVIPYTDQRVAVREWARVLRPGGIVNATYHGAGYGVHYLFAPPEGWRSRVYGGRMLLNTAVYAGTGRRLPGFFGDTLCQTQGAMLRASADAGLVVEQSQVVDRTLGISRILFHGLRKPPDSR